MVVSDGYGDSAGWHSEQRENVREARFVQLDGRSSARALALEKKSLFEDSYAQNGDAGYSTRALMIFEDRGWPVRGPIPSKAIATSLPPSPKQLTNRQTRRLKEIKGMRKPVSKKVEPSADGLNWTSSHSIQTSPHTSSRSMSLDSGTTAYKESDNQLHYPQPQTPLIDSSIPPNRHVKSNGLVIEDVRRLLKLRRRVQALRLQIQEQRGLVELKREAQSDADEQYIKKIRTNHVTREPSEQVDQSGALALEKLWRLCQAARDALGPAEYSLILMESRLEVEEAKLERREEWFYQQLDISQPASPLNSPSKGQYSEVFKDEVDEDEDEDEDKSSHQSSGESGSDSHDDYNEYLWRLGNLDILQERRQELVNQKSMLEEQQQTRQRVGMDLDIDNIDFLARFKEILEPLENEIEEVAEDVERLKQLCIGKGLINTDGNLVESQVPDEADAPASGEVKSELPAEHSKPSKHRKSVANNEVDSRSSVSRGGFGPFINLWLLHKLRSSAMEILLLACFVAASVHNISGLMWQAESRRLWELDDAVKDIYVQVGSYIIPSTHRSDEKKTEPDEEIKELSTGLYR